MDSLIPARGMGNYINSDPDTSTQRNRVYHKCACGGLMSEYAARAAGWTLPELFPWRDAENHNVDSLPTWAEIECRGMGE